MMSYSLRTLCSFVALLLVTSEYTLAADEVFSGPQVGEVLPPFTMRQVLGPQADTEVTPIAAAAENPILLVFVHKRERPAFGLANVLHRFAATRESAGLKRYLVFLPDDPTESEAWLKRIPQYFEKNTPVGISLDGPEGPGAYGLNRNVTLTILVGRKGKVTANYALVQPSIAADGPKILKSIVDATGGGDVPDIAEFLPEGMRDRMRTANRPSRAQDERLVQLLRPVIQKDASAEDVAKAAQAVEDYVSQNETARSELGQITSRVVGSERFSTYGTAAARQQIKTWAKKYGPSKDGAESRTKDTDSADSSSKDS